MTERERERERGGRIRRLKRSRDLGLEEIAKYYVNMDSVLHSELISTAEKLKGQIINSTVKGYPALLLSWQGRGERRAREDRGGRSPSAYVVHAVIRDKPLHGGE